MTAWLASGSRHPLELIHFIFPPSHKKFLHSYLGCLKSSWSRCKPFFFFREKFRSLDDFEQMSEIGRCFGLNLFEIFCENLRYFEISTNGRKYCRCRMGDHQVRVFAHHWVCAGFIAFLADARNIPNTQRSYNPPG